MLLFILLRGFVLFAQGDSVLLDKNFNFTNGVYSSFAEMLQNSPKYRDVKFEVREGPLRVKTLYFYNDNSGIDKYDEPVFAIVQNGKMSVNFDYGFHKLILLGSISTFYIEHKKLQPTFSSGWGMHAQQNDTQADLYFLDLKTRSIESLRYDAVDEVLKRDPMLYEKFLSVSKRKRKSMLYAYILEYNTRNPTYVRE